MTEENPPITRDDIEQGIRDLSGEITGQAQAAAPKLMPVAVGAGLLLLGVAYLIGIGTEVERRGDPANLMAGSRLTGPYLKRTFRLNATRKGLLGGDRFWLATASCSSPNGLAR